MRSARSAITGNTTQKIAWVNPRSMAKPPKSRSAAPDTVSMQPANATSCSHSSQLLRTRKRSASAPPKTSATTSKQQHKTRTATRAVCTFARRRLRAILAQDLAAANNPRVRIDAHQHFWRYDQAAYPWMDASMQRIARDFLPPDLQPKLTACDLDGAIAVQARSSLEETRFLIELARQHACVRGVVGWADLCANNLDEVLDDLCQNPEL